VDRAGEFWFPTNPDALQLIGGLVVFALLIVILVELARILWSLICR
jgi:hypothetical protein